MIRVLVMLVVCSPAFAATYYVSQSGGTFSGGSACNGQTAQAATFLASGSYTAGDTIYLCGTITSELSMAHSGTSGSKITVIFDTGASIQKAYCDTSGCFSFGGQSHVILDGGVSHPCGWNTATNASEGICNGFIEATANGALLGNQQSGTGIVAGSGSDIEIRDLGVYNIYVAVTGNTTYCASGCGALSFTGNTISIHDSRFHDGDWLLTYTWSTSSGWTVYNNEIYNMSHGIALAGATSNGSLTGMLIYGNYIHDYANWGSSGCAYHNDGIHIYAQGGSTVAGSIYNNILGGAMGVCPTAQIFQESTTVVGTSEYIYNNLVYTTDNPTGGTALIGLGPSSGGGTISLFNNTINCFSVNGGPNGVLLNVATFTFKNNLIKNCSPLAWFEGGTETSDYNAYDISTCTSGGNGCFKWQGGGAITTLASWQSTSSGDAHAQGGATDLSAAYVPTTGSSAIGNGTNLTSLSITALDSDLAGNSRPSSTAWDIGAYQYSASPSPASGSGFTAAGVTIN